MGAALALAGRVEEACAEIQEGLKRRPEFTIRTLRKGSSAIIRSTSPSANTSTKACARPGCPRDEQLGSVVRGRTAFCRFPLVHRAGPKGQRRVEGGSPWAMQRMSQKGG
jgi:hypothetical protein